MNVAELMELISDRQGGQSNEKFAKQFDFSGVTLFRWYKGERKPSIANVRSLARYFRQQGDEEMLKALAEYALFGDDDTSS